MPNAAAVRLNSHTYAHPTKDLGSPRLIPGLRTPVIHAPSLAHWGLIPPWAGGVKSANKMINARIETVATAPPYRRLIPKASRRALQIADGYFEWLKPEKRDEPRQPFCFQVDGGELFAFAALWTPAKIGDEWIHSLVMLTCEASPNKVASAIHDRMPVILADRDSQDAWIDQRLDAQDALRLCGALPTSRLSAVPANPALNKVQAAPEGPELLRAA